MTSGALPDNPFVAAGMIEDPRLFVGRKDELHAIASRMKGDQPTSINIVGEKHIGKSSLLHYFVRTSQQRVLKRKWILLFSGSQELSELDDYWSDYLINTRALRMTYLHELEARDLIQQPVVNFSNIYEPTAVDAIIQVTRCQPYLVQLVCYEVVELLNRDIRRNRREADTAKATAQDVKEVIPVVLERGDQYFRELWKSLTDSDRSLLRRIIHGETLTQQDKGVVRKLTRKEILTQEGNAFQVPLVQKYVEQLLEEE